MRFTQCDCSHPSWWTIGRRKRQLPPVSCVVQRSAETQHVLELTALRNTREIHAAFCIHKTQNYTSITLKERARPKVSWSSWLFWAHKSWDHWTEIRGMRPNQTSKLWTTLYCVVNNREKSQSCSVEDDTTTNCVWLHA